MIPLLLAIAYAFNASVFVDSIIGSNDLLPISQAISTPFYPYSRSIARMGSTSAGFCSAMRVASNLFMTNQHCVGFEPCSKVIFHMGLEDDIPVSEQALFQCRKLLHQAALYDYAIFEAQLISGEDDYPIAKLKEALVADGTSAFFPSYAGTFKKWIDWSADCQIVRGTPEWSYNRMSIDHGCDSMMGSSGSAIFDRDTGIAIALHWGGVGKHSAWNKAIAMHDILSNLKDFAPRIYAQLSVEN